MKIYEFTLGNVTFQERKDADWKKLSALTFYAECPLSCSGCLAPYKTKMQTIAALGSQLVISVEKEGEQNLEALKCPYMIARNYI